MKQFVQNNYTFYIPENVLEKSRGILWQEHLLTRGAMLFVHCNWVHSFGLKNPIKLYFFSSDFKLLEDAFVLRPNAFSPLKFDAYYTLETGMDFTDGVLDYLRDGFQEFLST